MQTDRDEAQRDAKVEEDQDRQVGEFRLLFFGPFMKKTKNPDGQQTNI